MSAARLLIDALKQPASMRHLSLRDWTRLVRVARYEDLLGAVEVQAREAYLLDALPEQIRCVLMEAARFVAHNHRTTRWELNRLARDLDGLGAPLLLLKGCAYLAADLAPMRGRMAGDVDLLVPRSWLGAVEAQLVAAGWQFDKTSAYDQRFYREWMHELPAMSNPARAISLDVHHTILPLTSRLKPDAKALVQAAIPSNMLAYKVLSPNDRFLHSATHLFYDGDFDRGLRNLWDLHQLASDIDWDQIWPRAVQHQLTTPLALALLTLQRLFDTAIPEASLQRARQITPQVSVLSRLIDVMLAETESGMRPLSRKLSQLLLYVRAHWLRMPPLMLAHHLTTKALAKGK